jgi:hypothetical protein
MLYEHFHARFWQKVAKEGSDFFQEISYFKQLKQEVALKCAQRGRLSTNDSVYNEISQSLEFPVQRQCQLGSV